MSEKRKKYDREFRDGAVRIVEETGKPIAVVARDLGVNEGTLGNWVNKARAERDGSSSLSKNDYAELQRLRVENAELRMERDVLTSSPTRTPATMSGPATSSPKWPSTQPVARSTSCGKTPASAAANSTASRSRNPST